MSIFNTGSPLKILLATAVLLQLGSGQPGPPSNPSPANLPDAPQITAYLLQAVDWYERVGWQQQMAGEPSDLVFLNNDRQISKQILQLAFDFAKAQAQLLSNQGSAQTQPAQASTQEGHDALFRAALDADDEVQQIRAELESDKQKLARSDARAQEKLQSTIAELESELVLARSRSQMFHNMRQFLSRAGTAGVSTSSLLAEIDQLQRSVPELDSDAAKAAPTAANPAAANQLPARPSQPAGILELVEDLLGLHRRTRLLDETKQATDMLADSSQKLREPLHKELSDIIQRGDQLAKQADTSTPAQLVDVKRKLDSLAGSFRQTSAGVLPLEYQSVLFELYAANLAHWRSAISSRYAADLRSLVLRSVIFGAIIVAIAALAEFWRRATFRYVHDPHRRYQILLVRRILLWCAIGITVAFAMATEIGSLATFVGLITAGIAVALQNVILAIAGYFFLIGKHGVRVGDRVQISGVTGDVADIGLVRLHLIEVGGAPSGGQLTGRIVVFSNAVVFQPKACFFRQIPGANFVWHQVTLTLALDSDYALAKQRMLEVVESVYAGYREKIEKQLEQLSRLLNVEVPAPRPYTELRMTPGGIGITVCYPVDWENAADIDDQVMRELRDAIHVAPELKLAGSGVPDIQPARERKKAA
jgi:hypothetical protein